MSKNTNKYLFLTELLAGKIFHKNLPLTVIYNVTDRCNSRCRYCYLEYYKRNNSEPSKENIFKVLAELKKMGAKRISFGGGEPLIREDIGEIIDFVVDQGMDCAINSNGILVPEKISQLKKLDTICISFDGDKATHDLNRGNGSFDKALAAIRCAVAHGLKVNTNTVLNQYNLNAVDYVLALAKKEGFAAEFNILIGFLNNKDRENVKASTEEIKATIKKIIDYKKRGYPVLISEAAYDYLLNWPDFSIENYHGKKPTFKYPKCYAGRFFCVIDTDGQVYACPHLIGKMPAKNCYEVGFHGAFKKLTDHDCYACYQVYHIEFNLLFGLNPGVILNHAANTYKRKNV